MQTLVLGSACGALLGSGRARDHDTAGDFSTASTPSNPNRV